MLGLRAAEHINTKKAFIACNKTIQQVASRVAIVESSTIRRQTILNQKGNFKVRLNKMVKDMTAVVAAASPNRGIGYQGMLPWKLPDDMEHFKKVTVGKSPEYTKNAVVMGRKTWESIPTKFRPLSDRINVVLTRQDNFTLPSDVIVASSLHDAKTKLDERGCRGEIFVIGGAEVYQQAMSDGYIKSVIYTEIDEIVNAKFDAYFPELSADDWIVSEFHNEDSNKENGTTEKLIDPKSGLGYRFLKYTRREPICKNVEEMQYLDLCRDVLESGILRGDRTGTGTLSKFGTQMRFSLRDDTLPLLTTKRTFWRGVAEELLWFVKGNTNANDLAAKDIHIWDGNGSRDFLDSRGLSHREVGDLGPVYGFQWRHFGAKYVDMHTDYTGQGVDQLAECIDKIKNNPEDRRIIMSAWNPSDLRDMALPPCHMFCQFYVDLDKNELSCQMYQRSADLGLGVPFNIASYALLTRIVAQVTGRKAGDFVHTIGDAHIYVNHIEALKEQLEREPRPFPKLKINPEKGNIDDFEFSDFEVVGYNPYKAIKMTMAV